MRRMTSVFGGSPKAPSGEVFGCSDFKALASSCSTSYHEFDRPLRVLWQLIYDLASAGGNPESNTLISNMTTVICLDDYHSLDRFGRKEKNVTALAPEAQNFDLMYEQVKALKEGKPVEKPIYNHVSGLIDPPETIKAPQVNMRQAPWSQHQIAIPSSHKRIL